MPVRSLNSRVLKWPERGHVLEALFRWAQETSAVNPNVRRVGYFGSFAERTDGVGSDLDVIIILNESAEPFYSRSAAFDMNALPVPVDLLVYTEAEWEKMLRAGRRIVRTVKWVGES